MLANELMLAVSLLSYFSLSRLAEICLLGCRAGMVLRFSTSRCGAKNYKSVNNKIKVVPSHETIVNQGFSVVNSHREGIDFPAPDGIVRNSPTFFKSMKYIKLKLI